MIKKINILILSMFAIGAQNMLLVQLHHLLLFNFYFFLYFSNKYYNFNFMCLA